MDYDYEIIETIPSEKELKKLKKKAERRERWERIKKTCIDVKDWCIDNPEKSIPLGSVILGGGAKLVKTLHRNHNLKEQKDLKELYVYDRSLGHYWKVKRPLKNSEWEQINNRKRNGESLGDILSSLRLLD